MLEPIVEKRLTPEQALKHKWFDGPNYWKIDAQVASRLKSYRKTNDLLFICQKIIVSCFLDLDSQKDVSGAFLAINTSDSGEITYDEL